MAEVVLKITYRKPVLTTDEDVMKLLMKAVGAATLWPNLVIEKVEQIEETK